MSLFRRKNARVTLPPATQRAGAPAAARPGSDLDWRSYDSVAEGYARVGERVTGPPAQELIRLLEIGSGSRVLDLGTGTGVAARLAAAAAPGAVVVGVDPSTAMLAQALSMDGRARYASALAIDLPFRDGTFSHLIANFVLSHVPRYETALFDMMRVLAPGGRLGVTNWAMGEDDDEFSRAWREVAEQFAEHEILQDAHDRVVPWEERFSDKERLKDALHEAGLRDIWVQRYEFRVEVTAEEYCADHETTSVGRFLRDMLGEEFWPAFQKRTREVFAQRFPERFHDFHQAILAVGHKP
jgi:ubiquinone/menaquinone biosynthesis C-methylase UbiE